MSNLYLISQTENKGYDTYDSAVVCANTAEEARKIHPNGYGDVIDNNDKYYTWVKYSDVKVLYLGKCINGFCPGDVVCSSFNAG